MPRLYRPERVDYDTVVVDPRTGASRWATAAVQAIDPASVAGAYEGRAPDVDGLRAFALRLIPSLRDFADRLATTPRPGEPEAHRYANYQTVRAAIRDGSAGLLAEVRVDGTVTVPGELDPELRRKFNGMINGWLPMVIRDLDREGFDSALGALTKARNVIDGMLREVVGLAACANVPMPWVEIAAAMKTSPEALTSWYAAPGQLGDAGPALGEGRR